MGRGRASGVWTPAWHQSPGQAARGGRVRGEAPPASQPLGDTPPASPPCLPSARRDLPVGTAHFFCLTSEASAGKLSAAVCKHPFPLRAQPAKRHQPTAWLAVGSHRLPGLAPGSSSVAGEGCPLLRSGSCSLTTGLRPPLVPQPHPQGSLCRPGGWGTPRLGDAVGRITELRGDGGVGEMRSSRMEQVSPRFGGRATS